MSFTSTVTVEVGDKSGLNDITDRVQGAQIVTRLRTGDFGTNRVVLTLRNDDGALTPGAGGTYTALDWFSQGLFIEGDTGTYTFTLFHGIITGFNLQDDGVNSTVTIEADDGYTVGGSATTTIDITNTVVSTNWIELLYNGLTSVANNISGVQMPLLGNTDSEVNAVNASISDGLAGNGQLTSLYEAAAPVRDFIRTAIMPGGPSMAFPTTIDLSTSTTIYECLELQIWPVRKSATLITFTFDEAPSSGELPFVALRRGFPLDDMLNGASISTLPYPPAGDPLSATADDPASISKYGARSFLASSVMVGATIPTHNPTGLRGVQTVAERWANTYSAAEFTVRSFQVSESLVRSEVGSSATSEEAWAQLLDVTTGPAQFGVINFTPAGGSSQVTEQFVTMTRTIAITPADIRVTVECLPLDQTGAFILDSSTLGVLDQNRLG